MQHTGTHTRKVSLLFMAALGLLPLAALAQVPLPAVQLLPHDPGTGPEDRNVPFLAWHEDLGPQGYVEQELLLSGTANVYAYSDEAAQSTDVAVASSGQPYVTRLLLRFPENPADFNGVVHLEILNATNRYDGAPMWNLTYPSIMKDGAAWAGITYSDTTARFMRDTWGTENFPAPAGAQPRDRSRYATLNISTRAHTWDIVSQAAALLKANASAANPLAGFDVQTVIVSGYSQSARYVNTYANSFYPLYSQSPGVPVVDGVIIAAGGPVASRMDGATAHPRGDARNFEQARAPTVRFTTESDIDSVLVRQSMADRPLLRIYEVAGSSHVDLNGRLVGQQVANYQFGISGSGSGSQCDLPLNPIRTGIPLSAIQHRLARWIKDGRAMPGNRLIQLSGSFEDGTQAWVRDADGNVVGGVRPARIEVPLGSYAGSNPYSGPTPSVDEIFCSAIIGSFAAFDESELINRYGNRRFFVVLTWWALFAQWVDGFVLAVDAPTVMNESKAFTGLPD